MLNENGLRQLVESRLSEAGVLDSVLLERSQFLDVYDSFFVELVVGDAIHRERIEELLKELGQDARFSGKPLRSVVRSLWRIEFVGEPAPARSSDGGLIAAEIVPVGLRSGTIELVIPVSISYLAGLEFNRLLGRPVDLREVARLTVERLLKFGGESAWKPGSAHVAYAEVNASDASAMYRELQSAA